MQFHSCQLISFINSCLCRGMEVKCLCLLLTERQREKQREGEVRWCQRWDFADSIFTHQTELFPVSTRPNLRSHHLTLSFSVFMCFISLFLPPPQVVSLAGSPLNVVKSRRTCFPAPARVV